MSLPRFHCARRTRMSQPKCRRQQDLVWLPGNYSVELIGMYLERFTLARLGHMINTTTIRRLAYKWTMCRHNELNRGEVPLQPEADLTLPRWMQMRINLIDKHEARTMNCVSTVGLNDQVLRSVYLYHVAKDINEHGKRRPVTFTHVRERHAPAC